jgi:hypothetical protein
MAEYINIRGQSIEVVASDPANPTIGQIWYNSTSNTLKGGSVTTSSSWATGTNYPVNITRNGSAGTQTATLMFGGSQPSVGNIATTNEYDGSTWTAGGSLNTARGHAPGAGTQTTAIAIGGYAPTQTGATEEYDGTSWTNGGSTATARAQAGAGGDSTAAVYFGGTPSPYISSAATELYNGTSWTSGNNMGSGRYSLSGAGSQTAALAISGYGPSSGPGTGSTFTGSEEYDGVSWTAGGTLNTGRYAAASGGIQTAALLISGWLPGATAATELYDGTSWTNDTNVNSPRLSTNTGAVGTTSASLFVGGETPGGPVVNTVEEYTGAGVPLVQTITAS